MRYGRSLAVQPDSLKGRVVCGTVYRDMHLKDLLGSFAREGYCIPVPDFYLVLHGPHCRISTIMDKSYTCVGSICCCSGCWMGCSSCVGGGCTGPGCWVTAGGCSGTFGSDGCTAAMADKNTQLRRINRIMIIDTQTYTHTMHHHTERIQVAYRFCLIILIKFALKELIWT